MQQEGRPSRPHLLQDIHLIGVRMLKCMPSETLGPVDPMNCNQYQDISFQYQDISFHFISSLHDIYV